MEPDTVDPRGFLRYQGMQAERAAVINWLTMGAAVCEDDNVQREYFRLIDDVREERHHK